jgi:hypothetical protein
MLAATLQRIAGDLIPQLARVELSEPTLEPVCT